MLKNFLFSSNQNIEKPAYVWNTLAGILNASQSVILLIVITRTTGLYDAGIFAIAFSIANLTLTLGKYGMRCYQVTDINEEYSFANYIGSRFFTSIFMILVSVAYALYGMIYIGYELTKFTVIILMCLWKLIDSVEDVFHGRLQQKSRLDVAAKTLSIRFIIGILVYTLFLITTKNLIFSTAACLIVSCIVFVIFTRYTVPEFAQIHKKFNAIKIKGLLATCFVLCITGFLSMYIANASKYAIDALMPETMQAYYNFIFMPVWVISLLASFMFHPVLTTIAKESKTKNLKAFKILIVKQIVIIIVMTGIVIIGAYLIGIPVLSWLYGTNLHGYRDELCILLMGGGMFALASFISIIITIVRKQRHLLIGYSIAAVLAGVLSPSLVKNYEILGASYLYLFVMFFLVIYFSFILVFVIREYFTTNKSI